MGDQLANSGGLLQAPLNPLKTDVSRGAPVFSGGPGPLGPRRNSTTGYATVTLCSELMTDAFVLTTVQQSATTTVITCPAHSTVTQPLHRRFSATSSSAAARPTDKCSSQITRYEHYTAVDSFVSVTVIKNVIQIAAAVMM